MTDIKKVKMYRCEYLRLYTSELEDLEKKIDLIENSMHSKDKVFIEGGFTNIQFAAKESTDLDELMEFCAGASNDNHGCIEVRSPVSLEFYYIPKIEVKSE